jgi:hypothetical protein
MLPIRHSFGLAALCGLPLAALAAETSDPPDANTHMADGVRDSVDNFVQGTVRRIDSFFVDSEHATFTDKKTRVRVRLNTDYIQKHGWEFSPKLKLNLVLPGLSERLRLVINDDQGADVDEAAPSDDDNNDVALRWVGDQRDDRGWSFDLGLRIKSGRLDPFARLNAGIEYPLGGPWIGQTTNRLFYYSKTGWRDDVRQYFDRAIGEDLLLRSRTRLQYFEEKVSNPFFEQKFSLFHSISDTRKVAYEVLYRSQSQEGSPFDPDEIIGDEQDRYQHYAMQIRFRQQFWRPWLYVEVWPIVAWPEERDYDTTLAARLRVEINFGGTGDERLDE